MGLFDVLRGELIDIIEWIDDSNRSAGMAFSTSSERDQKWGSVDCPTGAGGRACKWR